MKIPAAVVAGFLAVVPFVPQEQQAAAQQAVERAFRAGGQVHLDLSAGAYTVRGVPEDTIEVRWRGRTPEDTARGHAEIAVDGSSATIRTRGPKDRFQVEIDLPARTDIDLNLSAGDLKVRGLEGSKSVSVWAGDVLVEVGNPDQYRRVEASVRLGDLTMTPFGMGNTGGIFRKRSWSGSGQHSIKATLFAGDLKLVR